MKFKFIIILVFVFSFSFLLVHSSKVFAAAEDTGGVLFLSPSSGIYSVGDIFDVGIYADSGGQEINAAEAELSFNPKELEVESISKDGSIFNLWPMEPEFSNEEGSINFAGGSKTKFVGDKGLLLTVTFKALKSNVSRANLAAGAILAADGMASNIITAMKSGVYTLEPKEIMPQPEYPVSDSSQIDTSPPENFEITQKENTNIFDPSAQIFFNATDSLSGIDKYDIQIDNNATTTWHDDGSHIYKTPPLEPGRHFLNARVFDKAGNFLDSSRVFDFEFEKPPVITGYPDSIDLSKGEELTLNGETIPNAKVSVFVQRNSEPVVIHEVLSDNEGNFNYSEANPAEGNYFSWVKSYDKNGEESPASQKVSFGVKQGTFDKFLSSAVGFLTVFVPLAIILLLLGFLFGYGWYKMKHHRS